MGKSQIPVKIDSIVNKTKIHLYKKVILTINKTAKFINQKKHYKKVN